MNKNTNIHNSVEEPGYYYRFQDYVFSSGVDEFGNSFGPGRIDIYELKFPVLKSTPKGVWILLGGIDKKFILNDSHKKYACKSKEEALESFLCRKRRQRDILYRQLKQAEQAINIAEYRKAGNKDKS